MDYLKEYTKIIRRHVRSDRYGFEHEGIPKHANGKNSKGYFNRFSGTYQPFRLSGSDIYTHLIGDSPFFIVNKPQSITMLACVDIDHNEASDAAEIADRLNRDLFASNGFREPSRHGKGAYLWLLLNRDTPHDPDETNAILNSYSSHLRSFNKPDCAKVDAIKATLFTRTSRGVLATAPCYFAHSDAHVASFVEWYRSTPLFPISRITASLEASDSSPPIKSGENRGGESRGSSYMGRTNDPACENEIGPARRARLFRAMMIANPSTTEDEFIAAYQVTTPDNNRADEVGRDFRMMKAKFVIHAPSFDPRAVKPICDTVPAEAFVWKRRERLDRHRLADFVAVKLQDAFAQKDNGYFAMASRDATLENFRVLKQKGLVGWVCTSNQYTKLLDIAKRFCLLEVFEEFCLPTRDGRGNKVFNGTARMIGPGVALPSQRERFLPLYAKWKIAHTEGASKTA